MAGQRCSNFYQEKPHDNPKWKVSKNAFFRFGKNTQGKVARPSIFTLKTNKQTPIFIEIKSSLDVIKREKIEGRRDLGEKKLPDSSQSLYPGSRLNHPKQVNKFNCEKLIRRKIFLPSKLDSRPKRYQNLQEPRNLYSKLPHTQQQAKKSLLYIKL